MKQETNGQERGRAKNRSRETGEPSGKDGCTAPAAKSVELCGTEEKHSAGTHVSLSGICELQGIPQGVFLRV